MEDEVGHVATGKRWFDFVCGCERRDPISSWQNLVRQYFKGDLKPPLNIEARTAAKFSAAFYGPLSAGRPSLQPLHQARVEPTRAARLASIKSSSAPSRTA
ncbi:MAG: DUF455 family protein [Pseudomonadota bacterium]|nr:DUF455 family protein [Pseudomonadota bacterium]